MRDLTLTEWVPVVPLIFLMVWLGSYTQSFMPPITAANAQLLERTRTSDEIRVQLSVPMAPEAFDAR